MSSSDYANVQGSKDGIPKFLLPRRCVEFKKFNAFMRPLLKTKIMFKNHTVGATDDCMHQI